MRPIHSRSDRTLFALLAATIAAAATAQKFEPQSLPRDLQQHPPQIADGGVAGGIWGNGDNYKVSLHDGFVFYPYVGAALPHQPLRWRTTSVTVGGAELVDPAAKPVPVWSATRCDYDLGSVVERYDLQPRGAEQTFVLEGPPRQGDLVVRGELDTPLVPDQTGFRHGALQLRLTDGRAIVEYGAAVAIDQKGRRFPMATACDGTTVRLRLEASAVAQAAWPLVVDPIVANLAILSEPQVNDIDVLHETMTSLGSQARTWVAYQIEVAANDHDVWVSRFASQFGGTGIDTYREISTWDATHPRMAPVAATGEVLVVLATGPAVGGSTQRFVVIHEHLANDLFLRTSGQTPFLTTVDSDWRPDVGTRRDGSSEALVVWQRELGAVGPFANTATSAIYGGVWDAATGSVVTPAFVLRNRPNRDQERPSINREAEGDEFMVAFQEHDGTLANDDWDVILAAVDTAGNVDNIGERLPEAADPLLHTVAPRIGGTGGRYLLRYTVRSFDLLDPKPQARTGETERVRRVDYDHTTNVVSLPWPAVTLATSAGYDLLGGGVAYDDRSDSHWATAVADTAAGTYQLFKLGYRGRVVESVPALMVAGFDPQPGGVAFNGAAREFLFGYGGNDGSAANNRVVGAVLGYDAVAPAFAFGLSCGSGTAGDVAAMEDKQQIGAEGLTFTLENAPEDGLGLFILSVASTSLSLDQAGMNGCTLLADPTPGLIVYLVVEPIVGGRATHVIDIPEELPPFRLVGQWGYPATGANPAGIQASDGVDVAIGR